MKLDESLKRLNPYEGLCLTAADLLAEQLYHRRNIHRHALYMHGHGIVQGLQVELQQKTLYQVVDNSTFGVLQLVTEQPVNLQNTVSSMVRITI